MTGATLPNMARVKEAPRFRSRDYHISCPLFFVHCIATGGHLIVRRWITSQFPMDQPRKSQGMRHREAPRFAVENGFLTETDPL
jgi:hypothetical protein